MPIYMVGGNFYTHAIYVGFTEGCVNLVLLLLFWITLAITRLVFGFIVTDLVIDLVIDLMIDLMIDLVTNFIACVFTLLANAIALIYGIPLCVFLIRMVTRMFHGKENTLQYTGAAAAA